MLDFRGGVGLLCVCDVRVVSSGFTFSFKKVLLTELNKPEVKKKVGLKAAASSGECRKSKSFRFGLWPVKLCSPTEKHFIQKV